MTNSTPKADMAEYPEDIAETARHAAVRLLREMPELAHRFVSRLAIEREVSQALITERQRNELEIKRLRVALKKLSSDAPVGFKGNIQGQSDVRRQYARAVLGGGKP